MDKDSFTFSYESLWKLIIRPPRRIYKESDLGKQTIKYTQEQITLYYQKEDFY
jgi:hypothetical protein